MIGCHCCAECMDESERVHCVLIATRLTSHHARRHIFPCPALVSCTCVTRSSSDRTRCHAIQVVLAVKPCQQQSCRRIVRVWPLVVRAIVVLWLSLSLYGGICFPRYSSRRPVDIRELVVVSRLPQQLPARGRCRRSVHSCRPWCLGLTRRASCAECRC